MLNPQPTVEKPGLQDGCRAFDRGAGMPYVERNFRTGGDGSNP